MANINEILARAAALRNETALNSIDPERAGGIMYDTLLALNELWLQQGAALVISKIYASVAAMNADTSPVSDLTGKPIRPGMIVVIASSDSDNGSVYRYNGTSAPRWSLVGMIGNITPEDSLTSDSTQIPLAAHQGKVLDGKISQLGQDICKKLLFVNGFEKGYFALDGTETFAWPGGYKTGYIKVIAGTTIISHAVCASDALAIVVYNNNLEFIEEKKVIGQSTNSYRDYSVTLDEDGFVRCYTDKTSVPSAWVESYILIRQELLNKNNIAQNITDEKDKVLSISSLGELTGVSLLTLTEDSIIPPVRNEDWEQGTLVLGVEYTANNIIRTKLGFKVIKNRLYTKSVVTSGYVCKIVCYNADNEYVREFGWDDTAFYTDDNVEYIRILLSRTDDAAFTPIGAYGVSINICISKTINKENDEVAIKGDHVNSVNGQYVYAESVAPSMSPLFWEQGTIGSNGQELSAKNRLRTKNYLPLIPLLKYRKSANIAIEQFDNYGNFIEEIGFSDSAFDSAEDASKMRLVLKNGNNTAITISSYDGGDFYVYPFSSLLNECVLKDRLLNSEGNIAPSVNGDNFEYGTLVDGLPSGQYTTRLRTKYYYPIIGGLTYNKTCSDGFQVAIDLYDNDKNYLTEFAYDKSLVCIPANAKFYKLILKKADNSAFSSANDTGAFIYIKNQSTLSEEIFDIRTPSGFVPSYFESHLTSKINTIRQNDLLVGSNGDSFVFITDSHYETNTKHSPSLIRRVLERTNIKKVFHGGDVIDWGIKSFSLGNIRSWYDMLSYADIFLTLGNHDINITEDNHFTNKEMYALFMRSIEDKVTNDKKLYYYFDNPNQKIRYIFLDGHWPTDTDMRGVSLNYAEQLSWMDSVVSELDSSWGIVVLQHIVFGYSTIIDNVPTNVRLSELAELLVAKLDSYQADDSKPSVIAIITGHLHYDYAIYSQYGHYPIIATTTDSTWGFQNNIDVQWASERAVGTINEQAFDVVQIDRDNKKIYCTRIGYGNDRVFNIQ